MKVSGFDIRFGINVVEVVKKENGKYDVILSDGSTEETDVVLMATGRRPKISQLGLENTGIKVTQDGTIEVDEFENTSVPGEQPTLVFLSLHSPFIFSISVNRCVRHR